MHHFSCFSPDHVPGNTTGCTGAYDVTVCGACYYSKSVRDHPKRCRYMCPGRIDEECLQTYGLCVRNKMVKEFGKVCVCMSTRVCTCVCV